MKVIRDKQFNILEIGVSDNETQIINELNILGVEENNVIIDFSKTKLKINEEFFKIFSKKNFFNQKSLVIISDKSKNIESFENKEDSNESIDDDEYNDDEDISENQINNKISKNKKKNDKLKKETSDVNKVLDGEIDSFIFSALSDPKLT